MCCTMTTTILPPPPTFEKSSQSSETTLFSTGDTTGASMTTASPTARVSPAATDYPGRHGNEHLVHTTQESTGALYR